MDIEQQANYLEIIDDDFTGIKNMLDHIKELIAEYPVYTQLEFLKPIKSLIFEAWLDALDKNNKFLNNYNGGDIIEVNK